MQVLVLSSTYQPLYTCGVEKAIRLLYLGKAVSVKGDPDHPVTGRAPGPGVADGQGDEGGERQGDGDTLHGQGLGEGAHPL